ncbi:MAG: CDP-alcohol phosphatidyltransferase family protein [Spartobacteria bacterium]
MRVVILADESAHWKIAGLRQLERLALALNEAAVDGGATTQVSVFWKPELAANERFVPFQDRLSRVEFDTALPESADLLLDTHIFLHRNNSPALLGVANQHPRLSQGFPELELAVRAAWQQSKATGWDYIEDSAQIPAAEKRFLRATGKSQDGLVSRFINRPISRALSQILLKTPITPSAWTLAIFILPLLGASLLLRGNQASVVLGLLFFQLYSILDGCDGEIARAKYLESSHGRQLDAWCDVLGNLLMVLALGYGLSRGSFSAPAYFIEGIFVALLILGNELLLLFPGSRRQASENAGSALYPRHQQLFGGTGLLSSGGRVGWWLIQLTKRDVGLLAFLLLALAGQAAWILHLLGAVAASSALLALKSRLR